MNSIYNDTISKEQFENKTKRVNVLSNIPIIFVVGIFLTIFISREQTTLDVISIIGYSVLTGLLILLMVYEYALILDLSADGVDDSVYPLTLPTNTITRLFGKWGSISATFFITVVLILTLTETIPLPIGFLLLYLISLYVQLGTVVQLREIQSELTTQYKMKAGTD